MSAEEAVSSLGSSPAGLPAEEAVRRLKEFGPNELVNQRTLSPWRLLLEQFKDLMVIVLIVAALISGTLALLKGSTEEWIDTIVIIVIVAVNAILGFFQTYRAEKTIEALRDMASPRATVVRGGNEIDTPSKDLVPGDVIILTTGDKVGADARLTDSFNLKMNEAALTGESVPVSKDHGVVLPESTLVSDRTNIVMAGSSILSGRGRAVVVSTGMGTELGRIARMVQGEDEESPLQKKLGRLGKQIGIGIVGACVFIFLIGVLQGVAIEEMFLTAVSLAVAAIPEGLPAIVTISLALGLQRMAKRNAIMRRLPAVESLGSTTVICTDKTGTLTKGEMNITEMFTGEYLQVSGDGYDPVGEFSTENGKIEPGDDPGLTELLTAGILCNDSQLYKERDRWKIRGDPTEGTLIVTARKAGLDPDAIRSANPRVFEVQFDSDRKRMTTVHDVGGRRIAYMKGASESVTPLCSAIDVNGSVGILDEDAMRNITERADEMASRALRILAIARRDVTNVAVDETVEHDLTFLGLVGMIDAPRKEAVEALVRCRTAGIKVIMITGDHALTARSIARDMCLPSCDLAEVITGTELEAMSNEELSRRVNDVSVFARVSPEHKVRIVEALQKNGEIVAMTGDGVNDAPALKKADIGIAMGITGTDVAKESSQMILVDDNFASIVDAVEEGRGVYENIRKFVSYLLTCNSAEVASMFAASLIYIDPLMLPFLLPFQILWMNLVTDGLPALALGVDPTPKDVMERPPIDPEEPPITRHAAYRIFVLGAIMAASTLISFQLEYVDATMIMGLSREEAVQRARTVAFCTLVLAQLLLVFSARSPTKTIRQTGILDNKKLIIAVLVSFALQMVIVYLPGLNTALRVTPLGWEEWAVLAPMAMVGLVVNEIWKVVSRRRSLRVNE
ncbi:MAG TPA: cation-translocating P-type ATPase [Methanomassiliicoccales archaeon]|jgi:Ca2+-transporting ATPase